MEVSQHAQKDYFAGGERLEFSSLKFSLVVHHLRFVPLEFWPLTNEQLLVSSRTEAQCSHFTRLIVSMSRQRVIFAFIEPPHAIARVKLNDERMNIAIPVGHLHHLNERVCDSNALDLLVACSNVGLYTFAVVAGYSTLQRPATVESADAVSLDSALAPSRTHSKATTKVLSRGSYSQKLHNDPKQGVTAFQSDLPCIVYLRWVH